MSECWYCAGCFPNPRMHGPVPSCWPNTGSQWAWIGAAPTDLRLWELLKCVFYGNLARGWVCRNQSSISHCPWFWEHLKIWSTAISPSAELYFYTFFFSCSVHCPLCLRSEGSGGVFRVVRWTFVASHHLLADLWPTPLADPWVCGQNVSATEDNAEVMLLGQEKEKGAVWP